MKLKKIASLALAGVMAVSMLAGCSATSDEPTDDGTETTVTGSMTDDFVSEMNDYLKKNNKNITLTAGNDEKVAAQLEEYVKLYSNDRTIYNALKSEDVFSSTSDWSNNEFVTKYATTGHFAQIMSTYTIGGTNTAANLIVCNASVSNEAILNKIVAELDSYIEQMPEKVSVTSGGVTLSYSCKYTASVVCVENAIKNSSSENNGRGVKYVAVVITGTAQ